MYLFQSLYPFHIGLDREAFSQILFHQTLNITNNFWIFPDNIWVRYFLKTYFPNRARFIVWVEGKTGWLFLEEGFSWLAESSTILSLSLSIFSRTFWCQRNRLIVWDSQLINRGVSPMWQLFFHSALQTSLRLRTVLKCPFPHNFSADFHV